MKGIMDQMKEQKPINYSPPKNRMEYEEFMDNLEKAFMEYDEARKQRAIEKNRRQKENIECLKRKSKELGKEVPDELWIHAVHFVDQPVGSAFFERHKEWLTDEPKQQEGISNTEKILQFSIRNFPSSK